MKTIRLLTVGNSFSNDALAFLEDIARGVGGVGFEIGRASLGGCSLEKHWNLAQFTARHPDYRTYRLSSNPDGTVRDASLQEALAAAPWDYITFQQFSGGSWMPSTFEPWLGHLIGLARERSPGARVLLHQTWAYRSDSPFLPEHNLNDEMMFERIRANYAYFSQRYDCGLLPSGEAIQEARRAPGRTFRWPDPDFDFAAAEPPALPRQDHSFSIGWFWVINGSPDGVPQLRLDANHLNERGRYLVGGVWFERLTGLDARRCAFVPEGMDAADAAFLRETAHAVCVRHEPLGK